ncbi:uncharacterized protein [Watersipora subatra]|uniref:uncharacterized protein n=1 Tax=Watersipora subatra TaxID=2589382 RepID=UPI00355B4B9D
MVQIMEIEVIAPDFDTHLHRLEVFQRLHKAGLKLKPSKCKLLQLQVRYLGHIVNKDEVSTDPDKLKAVTYPHCPDLGLPGTPEAVLPGHRRQQIRSGGRAVPSTGGLRESHCLLQQDPHLLRTQLLCHSTEAACGGKGSEALSAVFVWPGVPPTNGPCVTPAAMQEEGTLESGTRLLEILAEFCYVLEHRSGTRHKNAEGLSRQTCEDWRQCARIEQKNVGPSRKKLAREQGPLATWVLTRCMDGTPTFDRAGLTLGNVTYPEGPASNSHKTPTPIVAGLSLGARGSSERLPATPGITGPKGELAKTQANRQGPVAIMYCSMATGEEVPVEHLEVRCRELDILHHTQGSLRIRQDGVLEARVAPQGHAIWCAIFPSLAMRETTVWQTHALDHYGKVAVDIVGPFPVTPRKNKWVLVLTNHFTQWQDALTLPDVTAPVVANALDERVFCYLKLPEQIHMHQGAQFESQLMAELCQLWNVEKTIRLLITHRPTESLNGTIGDSQTL